MSAASPVKLNQTDLKITTRSIEVRNPHFSDVLEYFIALNEVYEISRWIADPKYDYFREQMRHHIYERYEEYIKNSRTLPGLEERLKKAAIERGEYETYEAEKQAEISERVKALMESNDPNEISTTLSLLDQRYLQSLMHLNEEDTLRVNTISLNSPLELATIVAALPAAITALWGLVQIFDKLANLKKLKLEVLKLENELANSNSPSEKQTKDDANSFLERLNQATPYEKSIYEQRATRVRKVVIKISEIEVEVIES